MTKVLVVDDEPTLARGLMRAILHRRPDYAVLTAHSGAEAMGLLEEQHIDVVVTDLRMGDVDGFELLAWLVSHRPQLFALAMTGHVDDDTERRLHALGGVEYFQKPLDIDALVARMNDGLARQMRGHVHNVGLASFLQLVELERKTCTLEVRSVDRVGRLYLRGGELVDASTGTLRGDEAACAIIGWPQVSIAIDSTCVASARTIEHSVSYLVMEAMRLCDENERAAPSLEPEAPSAWGPIFTSALPPSAPPAPAPRSRLDALRLPVGALMLAIVDVSTGAVLLGPEDGKAETHELVQSAWQVYRQERTLLASHGLEEITILTSTRGELIRPLPALDSFAFLLFDTEKTNLVMARLELDSFMLEYAAAS
ncbi:MAG: response regulator [Polyangiales bacterium]